MHDMTQRVTSLFLGSCLFAACSSSDAGPSSGADRFAARTGDDGALYVAIAQQTGTGGNPTSYLITLPTLDDDYKMDVKNAVELPQWSEVDGYSFASSFWVKSWEAPLITRWELQGDQIVKGATLNFADYGVSAIGNGRIFSEDFAAFGNDDTGEMIVWDPTAMRVTSTIALDIPEKDAVSPHLMDIVQRTDGRLIQSYWYKSDDGWLDGAGVVFVDPEAREVVARDVMEGCNYSRRMEQSGDGTVYLSMGAQWSLRAAYLDDAEPIQPCLLRIAPDATAFDRSYMPKDKLSELSGAKATGNFSPTANDHAFFAAWDESLIDTPLTDADFDTRAFSTAGYRWWDWDMRTDEATPIPDIEPFGGIPELYQFNGDDAWYYSDQSRTGDNGGLGAAPFFQLNTQGATRKFTGVGKTYRVVRLR